VLHYFVPRPVVSHSRALASSVKIGFWRLAVMAKASITFHSGRELGYPWLRGRRCLG
jgi:hypothetical protein